jgi:hypothetical protein
MEGGMDNDLLSLEQTFSGENGDKAGEGEEKRGKEKNSESKTCARTYFYLTLWSQCHGRFYFLTFCVCREAVFHGE